MDVIPEINRNATFILLSFIGKELGTEVMWKNPNVIIERGNAEIICTIETNGAKKVNFPPVIDLLYYLKYI